MEYASGNRKSSIKRDLREIPAFINSCRRQGITCEESERRVIENTSEADAVRRALNAAMDNELLILARRRLALYAHPSVSKLNRRLSQQLDTRTELPTDARGLGELKTLAAKLKREMVSESD